MIEPKQILSELARKSLRRGRAPYLNIVVCRCQSVEEDGPGHKDKNKNPLQLAYRSDWRGLGP